MTKQMDTAGLMTTLHLDKENLCPLRDLLAGCGAGNSMTYNNSFNTIIVSVRIVIDPISTSPHHVRVLVVGMLQQDRRKTGDNCASARVTIKVLMTASNDVVSAFNGGTIYADVLANDIPSA